MKEPNKTEIFKIPLKLKDTPLSPGDSLPVLQSTMIYDKALDTTHIPNAYILISTFPAINTAVCSMQTKHMVEFCEQNSIYLLNISTDSYHSAEQWCIAQSKEINFYSDTTGIYLRKCGLYLPILKKAARAVLLFDSNKNLVYQEIVTPMSHEPSIEKLEEYIKGQQ